MPQRGVIHVRREKMIKDGFTLSYKNRWKIQYLKKFNTKIYKMKPELGKSGAL